MYYMIESLVNNWVGKTQKEMAVAYFKAPYWYFPNMTYETVRVDYLQINIWTQILPKTNPECHSLDCNIQFEAYRILHKQ